MAPKRYLIRITDPEAFQTTAAGDRLRRSSCNRCLWSDRPRNAWMNIRAPTEKTPPHLLPFVVCLAGVIFLVLGGAALLAAWLLDSEDSFRDTLLIYGGFLFAIGALVSIACWMVRRFLER
jgi:hypothetical protein